MSDPIDIDALERRYLKFCGGNSWGVYDPVDVDDVVQDILTALRQQQTEINQLHAAIEQYLERLREKQEEIVEATRMRDKYKDVLVCANNNTKRRDAEIARLQTTIGFFASVIKSGEPWTETCEERLRQALSPDKEK